MEDASRTIKYMEDVVLPFTLDSMTEFVTRVDQMLTYLNWFTDYPIEEQTTIANWLTEVHLFRKLKSFFVKTVKSYPQVFKSEVGDEVRDQTDH